MAGNEAEDVHVSAAVSIAKMRLCKTLNYCCRCLFVCLSVFLFAWFLFVVLLLFLFSPRFFSLFFFFFFFFSS